MGHLESRPYAKDLGVMSVFAQRAPFFLMAAVLFTVLATVFTLRLVTSDREVMGQGRAGEPFTIGADPEGGVGETSPIVSALGADVPAENTTCTMTPPGGKEKGIDIGLASDSPFAHDGRQWSPIAEVYPSLAGSSITCVGAGIERLLVTYDTKKHWWPLAVATWLGAPMAWITTVAAYRLRRRARR